MKIKTDIARLERAGFAYARWLRRFHKSVDHLAIHLRMMLPDEETDLPWDYTFRRLPRGDYKLMKTGMAMWAISRGVKPAKALLELSSDISRGWLNKVTIQLEREAEKFDSASKRVAHMIAENRQ